MSARMTVGVAGQGGKVLAVCKCGGEVDMFAGPDAKCPKCGCTVDVSLTTGPDFTIKAGDGPKGGSVVITGGTFGPGVR